MFGISKRSHSDTLVVFIVIMVFISCIRISNMIDSKMCLISTKLLISMRERNVIKLHVQFFLRLITWMFETCRRQYNWIKSLIKTTCLLLVIITYHTISYRGVNIFCLCYKNQLTFWCRNYLFNFSTPVYKMWIIQEPNSLELWNKLHYEEKKTEIIYHV